MKVKRQWIPTLTCIVAMLAASIAVCAQDAGQKKSKPRVEHEVFIVPQAGVLIESDEPMPAATIAWQARGGPGDVAFHYAVEMGFDGKVVKGAPYSAQAVTESVQALADGNRIVRKTTAAIYRDSEGRTRREQTLGAVGPWATAGEPSQNVFINDPVAGVSYILIPEARIARKMPRFEVKTGEGFAIAELSETERKNIEVNVRRKRSEEPVAIAVAPGEHGVMFNKKMPEPVKESLGKQMIEGVEAEGTRATFTIAAGEIGNEQPINVVHERWYSPELQVTVMTRHSDPRFGENTYRLTNINRSEPARSLFEVPSDYTIKEGRPERMRLRAKQPRENNEN